MKTGYLSATATISITFIVLFAAYRSYVTTDNVGGIELSASRLLKLEQDISSLDAYEQYVLKAGIDGYYECKRCSIDRVYLRVGEVWKYGITKNGKKGRYGKSLDPRLVYVIQFEGDIKECMIEEKRKIFKYPLLEENQRRLLGERLGRPPGNPVDN